MIHCLYPVAARSTSSVTLEDVLTFATGSDCEPAIGFSPQPSVEFLHEDLPSGVVKFPRANTCGVVLCLPIVGCYDTFVEYMESGIRQAPTFGYN